MMTEVRVMVDGGVLMPGTEEVSLPPCILCFQLRKEALVQGRAGRKKGKRGRGTNISGLLSKPSPT